jgi:hypothetical protein
LQGVGSYFLNLSCEFEGGKDPEGLSAKAGDFMPTFSNDTVVHAPKPATEEKEKKLLLDIGLRLAEEYLKNPPNLKDR